MASTTPADLSDLNHDGSTVNTAVTNEMAATRGYPMELVDGTLVNIVARKPGAGGVESFFAADGTEYRPYGLHYGKLVAVQEDVETTEDGVNDEADTGEAEHTEQDADDALDQEDAEAGTEGAETPAE